MSNRNRANQEIAKVEMIPAFYWICPECGSGHFERSVVVELSEEETQELRDDHGVNAWEEGAFLMCPSNVSCPDCKQTFQSANFGEDEVC